MPKLLVIEDDADLMSHYEVVLSSAGYNLELAASADEARKSLSGTPPDLAIVNIMMDNGLWGFELAREIHARFPNSPILVVSALNDELKEHLNFEPSDDLPIRKFLDKPVNAATLLREVEEALAER